MLWRELENSSGPWQQSQSALQAREAFLVRGFVSAGFMGNGVLPFFLFGFLCLPALFAASEAWLIIFDGTNHYEALKEIWIIDLGRVLSL